MKDEMLNMITTKGRTEFLRSLVEGKQQSATMRGGLPKLVEAADSLLEAFETPPDIKDRVRESIEKREEGNLWNPEVLEKIEEEIKEAQDFIDDTFNNGRMIAKALRAMVKTQLSLAKVTENLCSGMLIYSLSDTIMNDAAVAALKLGAGDEAIKALAKEKLGGK